MRTSYGWIEIDGIRYDHDVIVHRDRTVEKQSKKNPVNTEFSSSIHLLPITSSHFSRKKNPISYISGLDNLMIFPSHWKPFRSWQSSRQLSGQHRRSWIFFPMNIVLMPWYSMWSAEIRDVVISIFKIKFNKIMFSKYFIQIKWLWCICGMFS